MIECRTARPDELASVARLRQRMAEEMGGDWDIAHPGWRTRYMQYYAGRQASGRTQVFVALDEGTVIGSAIIGVAEDYRAYALNLVGAHVNAVYVAPSHRRKGVATRLMQLAIAWARAKGCVRVRLRASDEGRTLYESLGFRTGREMELTL